MLMLRASGKTPLSVEASLLCARVLAFGCESSDFLGDGFQRSPLSGLCRIHQTLQTRHEIAVTVAVAVASVIAHVAVARALVRTLAPAVTIIIVIV